MIIDKLARLRSLTRVDIHRSVSVDVPSNTITLALPFVSDKPAKCLSASVHYGEFEMLEAACNINELAVYDAATQILDFLKGKTFYVSVPYTYDGERFTRLESEVR